MNNYPDHETWRGESADRGLDLQAALIRAKQDNDRDRIHRPRGDGFKIPEPLAGRLEKYWKVSR